jgi:NADH-quinone oxidoreductase subunit G
MADASKLANITVDGKTVSAPAGSLLIEACKSAGIEVPAFCYYPNLSLQGACRMCLVRIEKMSKLQTACTTNITDGMVVTTDSDEIRQARKSMVEMLLGNHPLDCPVCDAGGECELQDMTFSYGAAESKYIDIKSHRDEQQWSPVVYFDRPRCILCYRCVRICGEGMDVAALGIENRGASSTIVPNMEDHLECEECGMCIDICPVGALTSGAYRYKTRPWEMKHVGTTCTHCADGCKTTLGVRRSDTGMEIVRGDNRDKSGINGDFLCIKGRYAFDFANHEDRLKEPLIRRNGRLVPTSWEQGFEHIGRKFREIRDRDGGQAIGVIGSTRTTNEENYLLQKFARVVLGTNNVDHHRTADLPAFAAAMSKSQGPHPVSAKNAETRMGQPGSHSITASMRDVYDAPAILLIGNNPTDEHPLMAWQIRNNVRLKQARLYVVNSEPIKLRRQTASFLQISANEYGDFVSFLSGGKARSQDWSSLSDKLRGEQNLAIIFGSEIRGGAVTAIAKFASGISGAKLICLADYANSRGAADMGLYPDLLPGYFPVSDGSKFREDWGGLPAKPGLDLAQMMRPGALKGLYVVGANPVGRLGIDPAALKNTFTVVQEMFLTETAALADVVLPAANAYEKAGTFTNTCGDIQIMKKAGDVTTTKPDFEMIVRIADAMGFDVHKLVPFGHGVRADMGQSRGAQSGEADRHGVWLEAHGLEPKMNPFDPMATLDEIQRLVPGYEVSRIELMAGNDQHTAIEKMGPGATHAPELIAPAENNLFTSGTVGRYSNTLNSVIENKNPEPAEVSAD